MSARSASGDSVNARDYAVPYSGGVARARAQLPMPKASLAAGARAGSGGSVALPVRVGTVVGARQEGSSCGLFRRLE
eukprot:4889446-Prymnesium_polylepis.1